jgi:preprotein translocase subunit YajC
MMQPAPSAPSTPAPVTAQPPAPTANITRTDGVVGGNAATATKAGTVQPADGGGSGSAPLTPAQPQGGSNMMLIMLLPLAALMLMMFLGNRKESKKRAEHTATLASLQRNDKVATIGGMIGTVAEIQDTEVVLKTDEITNSRVRIQRSAIASVLNRNGAPKSEPAKASA